MEKEGQNEKTNKYRLTTWVDREKAMLAKENRYNFSRLMDDALNIVLNIEGNSDVKIQRKITKIDEQINNLELERQLLLREIERAKEQRRTINEEKNMNIIINKLAKEYRDTGNVKNLQKAAAELKMTNDKLLEIVGKRAYNP